jgi:outer membrane lipoprotein-sorting protein
MNRWTAASLPIAAAIALGALATSANATTAGDQAIAKYAAAWEKVNTYTCSMTAREVSGTHVQDRTYDMKFRKPYDSRMDITGGDGRGSAAAWRGGDTVRGHQGGFISFIKLNLNIHDPKAVSIRGTTIAEANFGSLLDHLKSLKGATVDATSSGGLTKINVAVADPSADQNVTKEMMVLGTNDLPVEYDEWEGDNLVKHIVYTDVKLNVPLTDSDFNL